MLRLSWNCSRSFNARSAKRALGLISTQSTTAPKVSLFSRSLQTRAVKVDRLTEEFRKEFADDLLPTNNNTDLDIRPTNFRSNRPDLAFSHKLYERIKDLLGASKYHKALEALDEAKAKGAKVTLRVYVMVIENLILAEQFQEAENVLDMVRQDTSLEPGAIFFTQVIDAYFKRRKYKEACMIYQEMKALRKKPTAMLIQLMINCFTNMEEYEKADQVWADFFRLKDLANDMKVGGGVYGAMMWSYFRRGDVTKSLDVYKQFKESGLPMSTNIQNALLAILHSMGKYDEVMALYKSITSPTAVTYQRIISMAIERGDMKLMRETFNKARDEGLQLNLPTYNKILSAYCSAGMTKEALEFFDGMQDKMELSIHTYNALLSLFSRNSDSENFEKVANYLRTHDVQFNDYTYRVMLIYYGERSLEKFEGLWNHLKEKRYPLTVLMYNDYILGWERHGNLTNQKAESILNEMTASGIMPNEITFTNIISAKAKEGNFEEAMHWYHQMKSAKIKPVDITFVRLFSCILHNVDNRTTKNLKTILDEMAAQSIKPNIQIYTQMIDILGESGNLKALHNLVNQIQQEAFNVLFYKRTRSCTYLIANISAEYLISRVGDKDKAINRNRLRSGSTVLYAQMEQLPVEIIQLINSCTDEKSKRYLRQTCTRLFEIIDYSQFTLYFTRSRMMPEIVQTLSRYDKPISLTFTKTIDLTPQAINHLSALTNITKISCDTNYSGEEILLMSDLTRLTNLQSLQFFHSNYSQLLSSFHNLTYVELNQANIAEAVKALNSNTKVQHLHLGSLDDFSKIPSISHLTYLSVMLLNSRNKDDTKSLAQAHRLKELVLWISSMDDIQPPLYALTALKSLIIGDPTDYVEYLTGIGQLALEDLTVNGCLKLDVTRHWTSLTNLTRLVLDPMFGEENPTDALEFLTALSRLLDFDIRSNRPFDYVKLLPVTLTSLGVSITATNSIDDITRFTALQKLKISDYDGVPIDYGIIGNLTQLTDLKVFTNTVRASLTCVKNLHKLKKLKIDSYQTKNVFQETFVDFSKLPNLESLELPSITSEMFETFSSLSKLTRLDTRFQIDIIPQVFERLSLKTLQAPNEQQEEFWQSLVRITTLESLSITHVKSTEKIISLTALQNLTSLEVFSSSNLPYKCFTHLTSLQRLYFLAFLDQKYGTELMEQMPYLYHAKLK